MVKLYLIPPRGNANSRYFPYAGYLGLTPVRVDGVVRVKLDEDQKRLPSSSISVSVRCIESRMGRSGSMRSNVLAEYTQVLWSKPEGVEWQEIGNDDYLFKIIIPIGSPGYSYANLQEYRVVWRVEAVIDHAPIFAVGCRIVKGYELALIRHDTNVPSVLRPPPPSHHFLQTIKRAPVIRYQLATPSTPVGPLDIVSLPLILHPLDSSVVIRGITALVQRRIDLHQTTGHAPVSRFSPSAPDLSWPNQPFSNNFLSSSSLFLGPRNSSVDAFNGGASASVSTLQTANASYAPSDRPLIQTEIPSRTLSYNVANVESSGPFAKDSSGVYTKTLSLQWPAAKSHSRWATGETMQTELITVRFFVTVKLIVSSPSTGTESVDLQEKEIIVVSTNDSDRKLALSKCSEPSKRAASKSPRHRYPRTPSPSSHPTPPIPQSALPLDPGVNVTSTSFHTTSSSSSTSTVRRPHTSAGPRDRPINRVTPTLPVRAREVAKEDEFPGHVSKGKEALYSPPLKRPSTSHHPPSSNTVDEGTFNRHASYSTGPPASTSRPLSRKISLLPWDTQSKRSASESKSSSDPFGWFRRRRKKADKPSAETLSFASASSESLSGS